MIEFVLGQRSLCVPFVGPIVTTVPPIVPSVPLLLPGKFSDVPFVVWLSAEGALCQPFALLQTLETLDWARLHWLLNVMNPSF